MTSKEALVSLLMSPVDRIKQCSSTTGCICSVVGAHFEVPSFCCYSETATSTSMKLCPRWAYEIEPGD